MSSNTLTAVLANWCFVVTPEKEPAPCSHVLILGEAGVSKTYTARLEAAKSGFKVIEMACHAGTTAYELGGSYVPYHDGTVVWQDGKFAEAMRLAGKGERVALIIDEILRTEGRALSVLLTALTPHPVTGLYSFTTSRAIDSVDGVAVMETLSCDPRNLTVIATSNIGANYQTNDLDPAIQDRFVVYMQEMTNTLLQTILASVVDKVRKQYPSPAGGGLPANTVSQMGALWRDINNNIKAAKLTKNFSTRKLVAAIENSQNSPMRLADNLRDMRFAVVRLDNDGHPVKDELELVLDLIKTKIDDKVKGEVRGIPSSTKELLSAAMITGTRISIDAVASRTEIANITAKLSASCKSLLSEAHQSPTDLFKYATANRTLVGSNEANTRLLFEELKSRFSDKTSLFKLIEA